MKKIILPALAGFALLLAPAHAQKASRATQQLLAAPAAASGALHSVASNPNYRLTQTQQQQFRRVGTTAAAWLDTLRFTYSRFTPANLPQRALREHAPTRGAGLRMLRQENNQYNAAGKLTSDSTFIYNAAGTLNAYPTLVENYTYNAQGNILVDIQLVRISGGLQPYGRTTYAYNAQGLNTGFLDEYYFGGNWIADGREILTYNALSQVVTNEFQAADATGMVFSPFVKDLFTYNAAGQQLTDQQQQYVAGAYANTFLATSTYNGPQSQLSLFVVQRNNTATPQGYSQSVFTYDANGNQTQQLDQTWVAASQTYVDDVRYLYTYQRILASAAAQTLHAGLSLAPNPTAVSNPVMLHYTLPVAAPVAVQVLDVLGRLVVRVPAAAQAVGEHTLALPAQPLAAGLYMVHLTAGAQSQAVKLVVE